MDLLHNDKNTVTLELSAGYVDYKEIKIPSNTMEIKENITPEELLPEVKKFNLVKIKDNLKGALNSETLSSLIDSAYTEYGLDAVDGSMTDDEINALVSIINDNTNNKIAYSDPEVIFDDDLDIAALK